MCCRLNQDVASLELQPTLEDVFHADTTSVEEYLQQIQDMTILTAIQVGKQATCLIGKQPTYAWIAMVPEYLSGTLARINRRCRLVKVCVA